MIDVQKHAPDVPIAIDRVGIRGVRVPLLARDRAGGTQQTVAVAELSVDLPCQFKGTHMSRFVESMEAWEKVISYQSIRGLLGSMKERLFARRARVHLSFPYFIRKKAPSSGAESLFSYDCAITGELDAEDRQHFRLEITVPVMTVCPCSKAISDEGAHSQRTLVRMSLLMKGFAWIEDFVEMAEASGSCELFTLLKREDEKYVTETAFAHPCFVEDVVRNVAQRLSQCPHLTGYRVEVESMESIHGHNACAVIENSYQELFS